ncbi:MAG TPA: class E sortase [Acidimicrobiales bacterium]
MAGPTTVAANGPNSSNGTVPTAPADAASRRREGSPGPVAGPLSGAESVPLLQQFCEQLVAEAVASVRVELPGTEPPPIDWRRLLVSDPAASPERAAGHAAVVAQQIASEVLTWKQSLLARSDPLSPPRPPVATDIVVVEPAPPAMPPASHSPWPAPGPAVAPPSVAPRDDTTGLRPAPAIEAAAKLKRRNTRLRRAFVAFGWMRDFGLILIAFAAWQLWGTSIEQSQAQQTLRQQFESHLPTVGPQTATKPTGPTLISAAINVHEPPEGAVVGRLQIPSIGVDQYIVEGTSEADLSKGPGHYIGTSMPGQAGNVAIAGHRTTYGAPFYNLNALKVGDQISLISNSGQQLTYVVSTSPVAVSPKDVAVLDSSSDNRLTLTTCNPRFSSSQRLVVVADLSAPHTVAVTPTVPSTVKLGRVRIVSEPIGWNTGYISVVLLFAALLVGLGLANRRARAVYGRIGRWLVLTPIWVAGLVFFFESLTRLLPANL